MKFHENRYLCQILMKFEFSQRFLKNIPIRNFMKIRPVGAELFSMRTDGRRDVKELIVDFRTVAKAPKIVGGGICHQLSWFTHFPYFRGTVH